MNLTDKNFEEEVIKSNMPVLVEFWASWCPPCRIMNQLLDKLEREYDGKIKIGKLNVDLKTPKKYRVMGLPTFIVFIDGKEIYRAVAAKTENELRKIIEETIKRNI